MTDERWIEAVRSAARAAMVINADASLDGPTALLILENMGKHIADLRAAQIDVEPLTTAARKILRVYGNGQPKQLDDAVLLLRAAMREPDTKTATPRTDEAAHSVACVGCDREGNNFLGVPVSFARELERELIELRKEYGKLARGEVFVHL